MSSIPLEVILFRGQELYESNKMLRLLRMRRLYRLFKIFRVKRIIPHLYCGKKCQQRMRALRSHSGVARMLSVIIYVVFSLHIITCLWIVTSKNDNYHPDTWLVRTGADEQSPSHQYLIALYWAFQTVTTVGFGDIPAITVSERCLALFWMVFGVGFYSFTVGNLTSIITSLDAKSAIIRNKIDSFYGFSTRVKLPQSLIERVVRHLEQSSKKVNVLIHQEEMIAELPSALRAQIINQTHSDIIKRLHILHQKKTDFIWLVLHMLEPQHIYEQEYIYMEEEYAEEVYFVFRGRVILKSPDKVPFVRFLMGTMFGEVEILYNQLRYSSAYTEEVTDLLIINKKNFETLMSTFPKIKAELKAIAKEKIKRHNQALSTAKSKRILNELAGEIEASRNDEVFKSISKNKIEPEEQKEEELKIAVPSEPSHVETESENTSRLFMKVQPKMSEDSPLSKNFSKRNTIEQIALERLNRKRTSIIKSQFEVDYLAMQRKKSHANPLGLILQEESKMIVEECEGLQVIESQEKRQDKIKEVELNTWGPVYSERTIEQNEEGSRAESSSSGMSEITSQIESVSRKKKDQNNQAMAINSFNQNMNLLSLNAACIFKIFDTLGTESKQITSELGSIKKLLERSHQKQARNNSRQDDILTELHK